MAEAARVVRLSGYGKSELVDAIQSGMLSADATRAYRQVLTENARLERENNELRVQLRIIRANRANERRCKIEAYRMVLARDADYQRSRDWRRSVKIGIFALGGLVTAIATVVAVLVA